jgi:hypothetical protein
VRSGRPKAYETVQWTVSSDERRELGRAAGRKTSVTAAATPVAVVLIELAEAASLSYPLPLYAPGTPSRDCLGTFFLSTLTHLEYLSGCKTWVLLTMACSILSQAVSITNGNAPYLIIARLGFGHVLWIRDPHTCKAPDHLGIVPCSVVENVLQSGFAFLFVLLSLGIMSAMTKPVLGVSSTTFPILKELNEIVVISTTS